jgi:hypothetical protein
MKRCATLSVALLAVVVGSLGFASNAEAFFGCRRSCTTCYTSPVYTYYYQPTPVYYQPACPTCQPSCGCQSASYAPAAYPVPVVSYYAPAVYAPAVYAPAVVPVSYEAPYRERVRVHVDNPYGRDYRYDYARTGNYVRVRASY